MPTSTNTTVVTNTRTTVTTTVMPPNRSNWNKKTGWTAFFLLAVSTLLFWGFTWSFKKVEKNNETISVYWNNSDSLKVSAGPSWFFYDKKKDSISSSHSISDGEKLSLLALVKSEEDKSGSYSDAISELSFKSNKQMKTSYLFLLVLSGICGAIGVQMRSIHNFIGNTCFKNEFNFDVWWPWYFIRPLIGCLVGPVVFIIFDGKLVPMSTPFSYSNVLLIAVSILAGFGAEDVLNTLRTLSKRVFGYKEEK